MSICKDTKLEDAEGLASSAGVTSSLATSNTALLLIPSTHK